MNKFNKLYAALAVGMTILATAGVASADTLTDAVDDVRTQVVGYAAPIAAALVAVGLAFVAVRLIPRVIKWLGSRL